MTMTSTSGERRWRWFAAWSLPGVCVALGVTALGVFTLPVGLVLVVVLSARRRRAASLGLLAGVGVVVTLIGSIHLDYQACSAIHESDHLAPGVAGPVSGSCGGIDGVPWMIVGIALTVAAVVLYLHATRPALPGSSPTSAPALRG
jgi:hypothetical protein